MQLSKKIFIEQFQTGKNPADIIASNEFKAEFLKEFEALDYNANCADVFFTFSLPVNINLRLKDFLISYESMLSILEIHNKEKFNKIHKGSPFYWLSINSFMLEDFERGVYYMDAAFSEDDRAQYNIAETPSGLFFTLNTDNTNQAGYCVVNNIKYTMVKQFNFIKAQNGPSLTISDFTEILSMDAIIGKHELRTIITSLISYIFEYEMKKRLLALVPNTVGTAEPFFLHFWKGCVVFESLLANSEDLKNYKGKKVNFYLGQKVIRKKLELMQPPKSINSNSYEDLIQKIQNFCEKELNYNMKTISIAAAVRNLFAHSIGWPNKPSINEFKDLHFYILGAICLTLKGLYGNKLDTHMTN